MKLSTILIAGAVLLGAAVIPKEAEATTPVTYRHHGYGPSVSFYFGPGYRHYYSPFPFYRSYGYHRYYYPPYRYDYQPRTYYNEPRDYRRQSYKGGTYEQGISDRCSKWSQRCRKNWGYRNPDYYGCLRYHKCSQP